MRRHGWLQSTRASTSLLGGKAADTLRSQLFYAVMSTSSLDQKKHAIPYSRQNLSNSIRQGTFQSDALKQEVAAALHDLDPAQATAEQVNQTLLSACAKIFPAQAMSSEPRPWQTLEVQVCVKNMWQAYHSMRRVSHYIPLPSSLSGLDLLWPTAVPKTYLTMHSIWKLPVNLLRRGRTPSLCLAGVSTP